MYLQSLVIVQVNRFFECQMRQYPVSNLALCYCYHRNGIFPYLRPRESTNAATLKRHKFLLLHCNFKGVSENTVGGKVTLYLNVVIS